MPSYFSPSPMVNCATGTPINVSRRFQDVTMEQHANSERIILLSLEPFVAIEAESSTKHIIRKAMSTIVIVLLATSATMAFL